MENAVDALKMAAAILIFIIALATSFSLFGTAKETADSIITMRDKQAYLESATLQDGILYTSASAIRGENEEDNEEDSIATEYVAGVTKNGDRIVGTEDIISTIYRYSKERYGVTIIKQSTKEVIARFDSNTENVIRQWYNIITSDTGKTAQKQKEEFIARIKENLNTKYLAGSEIELDLEEIYAVTNNLSSSIKCGAPWYGDETQIKQRIAIELNGGAHEYNGQVYEREGLIEELQGKKIVEVTNEIDNSKYLEDSGLSTNLLQQYDMPTIEIVYIILD